MCPRHLRQCMGFIRLDRQRRWEGVAVLLLLLSLTLSLAGFSPLSPCPISVLLRPAIMKTRNSENSLTVTSKVVAYVIAIFSVMADRDHDTSRAPSVSQQPSLPRDSSS